MIDSQALYAEHQSLLDSLYTAVETGELAQVRHFADTHPALLSLTRFGNPQAEGPLHVAARYGQERICELLLECGLELDRPALRHGRATALELAASGGHLDTCQTLLRAGAQVEGRPDSVCGPLHGAAINGHHDVVELLRHGADANRLHRRLNKSPLDAAITWKHPATEQLLRSHGVRSINDIGDDDVPEGGNSILNYVQETVGRVLPMALSPASEGPGASLHVSLVGGKNDFKLLFTLGLFQAAPMTELFICLPGDWALPHVDSGPHDPWRFPVRLLSRLARRTLEHGPLAEAALVRRDDTAFADLPWPAQVDALLVVDKPWSTRGNDEDIPEEEKVHLLTLAPVRFTRQGAPSGDALAALVERKRKAGWKALALEAPL